jgi:hypothetical protein
MSTTYSGVPGNVAPLTTAVSLTIPVDGDTVVAAAETTPLDKVADYLEGMALTRILDAALSLSALTMPLNAQGACSSGFPPTAPESLTNVFIVVGDSGAIYTSPWFGSGGLASRTSGTANGLKAIDSNGTMAVAVGDGGTIVTSTDGITWTVRTSGTASDLCTVKWISSISKWVAAGDDSSFFISSNGITWAAH